MSSREPKTNKILSLISTKRDFLCEKLTWFPLPVLVPVVICVVLFIEISFGLSPQMAIPIQYPSAIGEPSDETAIHYSVLIRGNELVLINDKRHVIRLPRTITSSDDLVSFADDLSRQIKQRMEAAVISRRLSGSELNVIFRVDESVRYAHIRPLLQSLAASGISNYGFAVNLQDDATNSDPAPSPDEGGRGHG